jgi:uncharacterized MAPEG superfamily protein
MSDIGLFPTLTTELVCLFLATILGIVQLSWAAIAARGQQGLNWARGPRDEPRPVIGAAARLDRAFRNFLETYPFFAAAILMVLVTQSRGALSEWGAVAYLAARIIYVPLYAAGVPTVRTLVWLVGLVGLVLVLIQPFA